MSVVGVPESNTTSSVTLQDYLNDTQRILHDATNRFWSQSELIDYINKSRRQLATESDACRRLEYFDILVATDLAGATYDLNTLLTSRRVMDVKDILIQYSSNSVYQLRYLPFMSAVRNAVWQYQKSGTPSHYTINNTSLFILPWPAQEYNNCILDCVVDPAALTTVDQYDNDILFPYTECVPFYAAYLAKVKDRRRDEAEEFMMDYQRRKMQAVGAQFSRRIVGA